MTFLKPWTARSRACWHVLFPLKGFGHRQGSWVLSNFASALSQDYLWALIGTCAFCQPCETCHAYLLCSVLTGQRGPLIKASATTPSHLYLPGIPGMPLASSDRDGRPHLQALTCSKSHRRKRTLGFSAQNVWWEGRPLGWGLVDSDYTWAKEMSLHLKRVKEDGYWAV